MPYSLTSSVANVRQYETRPPHTLTHMRTCIHAAQNFTPGFTSFFSTHLAYAYSRKRTHATKALYISHYLRTNQCASIKSKAYIPSQDAFDQLRYRTRRSARPPPGRQTPALAPDPLPGKDSPRTRGKQDEYIKQEWRCS